MKNFAFHDLAPEEFPADVEFFVYDDARERHVVKRDRIEGAGVFEVPAWGRILGRPVGVTVTFGTGQVITVEPPDPQ